MYKKVKSLGLILAFGATLYGCSPGITDSISPNSTPTDSTSNSTVSTPEVNKENAVKASAPITNVSPEVTTEKATEASTADNVSEKSTATEPQKKVDPSKYTNQYDDLPEEESDWCLILVNRDNPIPEDYEINLKELANGEKIDERIYPFLQALFDDMRSRGMDLFVRAGYRTHEDQQKLMDETINGYKKEGHSEEEATEIAKKFVALPGTSEHELGICIDINANIEVCSEDDVYSWLEENAYKYGFIKRYPENKIDITGINNEPWHYRYVGKKAAREMTEQDLCLEEYIENYTEDSSENYTEDDSENYADDSEEE